MSLSKSSAEIASTPDDSNKQSINEEEKAITSEKVSAQNSDDDDEDISQYISGLKLGLVMLGLSLSCLLVGLVCFYSWI
jgi:F0F1-type ATP synthase assembly protein I